MVADTNADVLVIPRADFIAALRDNAAFARDINVLAESRRKAISAPARRARGVSALCSGFATGAPPESADWRSA